MSDNSKNDGSRQDDIDLIALLEGSVLFFRKYKWVFLVAIIAGLLLGYLRYRALPTVYKSRMIVQSTIITNQNGIQIVANWNQVLRSGDYAALAKIFNLGEDIICKAKQVKAEEIQKIFTANNPNGFIIEVMVTDNSILADLQNGIVYGFENNGYVKDRLQAKRNRLQEMIDKTGTELNKMDSTKKMVENALSGKGSSTSSLIVDASTINRQWIEMNEKHLSLKEDLKFSNGMQVLQDFTEFKNPAGPNLFLWLLLGLISCVAIAFIYTLFRSINQKLKNRALSPKES